MSKRTAILAAAAALVFCLASQCLAVGKYSLAYWRQMGHYEVHGTHVVHVHVFNENGTPRANVPIAQVGGGVLAYTNQYGHCEIPIVRAALALRVADGSNETDETPLMDETVFPDWGHRGWECAFMYKTDRNNPGTYNKTLIGTPNVGEEAPCTRSLAYWSTNPLAYYSDDYELDTGANTYYQTFTVPAGVNRITACKFQITKGFGTKVTWTAQICQGNPPGTPIGPARTTRELNSDDYWQFLVAWGVNDVPVTPGQTYCVKITESSGSFNIWRVKNNNYPGGQMYRNLTADPARDLVGLVVGMDYGTDPLLITNEQASPSTGSATITWTTNVPATSRVDYGSSASYGKYVYDETLKTSHSITIPNLRADTQYQYKITSTRLEYPEAYTGNRSFWTNSATPNLLQNPGFETGSFAPWQQPGIFGIGGWCTWGVCPHGGAYDVVSASSYSTKNGQFYQVVSGVVPGATYTARGWIWTRQVGGNNNDVAARIGIHPTGGTTAAGVTWSPTYSSQDQWSQIGVVVPAASDKITFFFDQINYFNLEWNISAYDDCSLTGPAIVSVDSLKTYPDGAPVVLSGDNYVTAITSQMNGALYVEKGDRTSGIRVAPSGASGVTEGQKVNVSGWLTTIDGERVVMDATVTAPGGSRTLRPLSMPNKDLGGSDLNMYAKGVTGGTGPNNIGLLVETWGRVVSPSGTGYRYITDGSGNAVKLDTTSLTTIPNVGQFVMVRGISRLEKSGSEYKPVVKPRKNSDVTIVDL